MLYGDELTVYEQQELCTLIYYPREKLSILMDENKVNDEWYRNVLNQLIQIAKLLSSKYTRSKVRKAMPVDFAYIIDDANSKIVLQGKESKNLVIHFFI